jgi:hypothetical protein
VSLCYGLPLQVYVRVDRAVESPIEKPKVKRHMKVHFEEMHKDRTEIGRIAMSVGRSGCVVIDPGRTFLPFPDEKVFEEEKSQPWWPSEVGIRLEGR